MARVGAARHKGARVRLLTNHVQVAVANCGDDLHEDVQGGDELEAPYLSRRAG